MPGDIDFGSGTTYCTISNCSAGHGSWTLLTTPKSVVVTSHTDVCQPWHLVCDKEIRKTAEQRPKFEHAESQNWSMSRVPLASAEAKFRRSGHGSQAMPNNSKWYSRFIIDHVIAGGQSHFLQTPTTHFQAPTRILIHTMMEVIIMS